MSAPAPAAANRASIRQLSGFLAVGVALCIAVPWQISGWTRQIALDEIANRSGHTLNLVVENLRGELAKHRYQPQLLAANPAFRPVLKGKASAGQITALNYELERINTLSGALDTYLMDTTGLTVAASNWSSARPFVGRNFGYRPYFKAAMQGRLGRYFALGSTSGERGYYFAYPVRENQKIIGAIVVKMRVGHLEKGWRSKDHEVVVADPNGVIFLSSNPAWHFRTMRPISDTTRAALRASRQYGSQPFEALRWTTGPPDPVSPKLLTLAASTAGRRLGEVRSREYLVQEAAMADAGWTVTILTRTSGVAWQVNAAIVVTGLLMASLTLAAANIYQRRRRIAERIAVQEAAKADLKRRVRERTTELTEANALLTAEIQERQRAVEELRQTQSELVQATKLAALGQMSAGLSHELNQPLAAIRTYADNARALIERRELATASKNLLGISDLIERMSRIIANLRTYARNEPVSVRPTLLYAAIDGALNLLDQRIKSEGVTIRYEPNGENFTVQGGDVRLQQVFVNLISNALDAVADSARKELHIRVYRAGGQVIVRVRDTGPGIAAEQLGNVFDPFYSTKGVGQGMGLGLSITYGIVEQFGGSIEGANDEDGGAVFTIKLVDGSERRGEAA